MSAILDLPQQIKAALASFRDARDARRAASRIQAIEHTEESREAFTDAMRSEERAAFELANQIDVWERFGR